MSEYRAQKAIKPLVEDMIEAHVTQEHRPAALASIQHIRSFKMTPAWANTNAWKFNYKGKRVGYFRIHENGDWTLSIFAQFDQHLQDLTTQESEAIQQFVQDQVGNYIPCGGCMPGLDRRTVTKERINLCACSAINMQNPDALRLEFARKLIVLRREAIQMDRVPKCNYIKPGDRT